MEFVRFEYVQNLETSYHYIFRILQHFATKLCNLTSFKMLFLVVKDFPINPNLVYYANCPYLGY